MKRFLGRPILGHAVIGLLLIVALVMARAVYLGPRDQERKALRATEARLEVELADLASGFRAMAAWAKEHPGSDFVTLHARRALPVREMVATFLHDLVPIAERHGIRTESIQPHGPPVDSTVPDASGAPVTYRRVEFKLRVVARYESLGEYVREVEAMDQLVIVRSVAIESGAATESRHVANVTVWIYGTL